MSKSSVSEASVYSQKDWCHNGAIYLYNKWSKAVLLQVLLFATLLIIRLVDVTFYENE